METQNYIIRFESGDEYTILAVDEKNAFEILCRNHPECFGKDIHSIRKERTKPV